MLNKHKYSDPIKGLLVAGICFAASASQAMALGQVVEYTSSPDSQADIIIDTRSAALCEKASSQEARCLPALDFFGPHKRLANFSGVLWLLGTAGLTGNEHVLIVGNKSTDKEAMAGLLFIVGQQKISILRPAIVSLKESQLSRGVTRSKSREEIYQTTMRSNRIILRDDLIKIVRNASAPAIFDGRNENEYWGQSARAQRGGHIPGAQHMPAGSVELSNTGRLSSLSNPDKLPVSYAHNAYEGLTYLARLEASGIKTRLYLEGWAGWASDGALPADSVTYPDRAQRLQKTNVVASTELSGKFSWFEYSGLGIGGVALAIGGFFFGRTMSGARG